MSVYVWARQEYHLTHSGPKMKVIIPHSDLQLREGPYFFFFFANSACELDSECNKQGTLWQATEAVRNGHIHESALWSAFVW